MSTLFLPRIRQAAALLLAAVLAACCAGCSRVDSAGPEYDDSIAVPVCTQDSPLAGIQSSGEVFCTQNGFYWFDASKMYEENYLLLRYGDWDSARLAPLCSQPNCTHSDAGCSAFYEGEWFIAAVCEDGLLLGQMLHASDGTPLDETAVWRVSSDGVQKERLAATLQSGVVLAACSEGFWYLNYSFRDDDGALERLDLLFYEYESEKSKLVSELPAELIYCTYGIYNNRFYYETDSLYAVQLTTGQRSGPLYTRTAFPGVDTAGQNLLRRGGTLYIADDATYSLYTLDLDTAGAQPVLRCRVDSLLEDELHQLELVDVQGDRAVVRRYDGQWAVDLDTGALTAIQAAGVDPDGTPFYPELAAQPLDGSAWLLMYGYIRQQPYQYLDEDGTLYSGMTPRYIPCRFDRMDYLNGVVTIQELDSAL